MAGGRTPMAIPLLFTDQLATFVHPGTVKEKLEPMQRRWKG
jgi:hypothetical protein